MSGFTCLLTLVFRVLAGVRSRSSASEYLLLRSHARAAQRSSLAGLALHRLCLSLLSCMACLLSNERLLISSRVLALAYMHTTITAHTHTHTHARTHAQFARRVSGVCVEHFLRAKVSLDGWECGEGERTLVLTYGSRPRRRRWWGPLRRFHTPTRSFCTPLNSNFYK